jgi:hypothetical protein
MFGASKVPIDFRWASLRGMTRKPVDGAADAMFSPVTSKLVPPDFLRANALMPNGGIDVVILCEASRASDSGHKRARK